jgi:phosphate transport system protein
MRNQFNQQMELLDHMLIELGALIEKSITLATQALVEKDTAIAQTVIELEQDVDNKEKDIETLCLRLLLQQQPVAGDLRLISAALQMINDMERIGDQSADISELTILMAGKPYIKKLEHIPQMAEATIKMVSQSIDAFVKKDLKLAQGVIVHDDIVDELFVTVKNDLIALIRADSANGEQALDLFMVAKYFERIGDHAVNIAEWVVYSITGVHGKSKK